MSPMRSPRTRSLGRRLVLLPALAAVFAVGAAPATAPAKSGKTSKGGCSDAHKPYGKGDGRKFK
jgi:hypothetical protein